MPEQKPRGGANRPRVIWGQRLGREDCPYLRRWVVNLGLFAIRVHHWIGSDDPRHLHDHPWGFLTFALKGGYTDIHADGVCLTCDILDRSRGPRPPCPDPACVDGWIVATDELRTGSIRYRPAHHLHTVKTNPGGCWTLLLTGREQRRFGYWVGGRWMNAKRYFLRVGLHPCD